MVGRRRSGDCGIAREGDQPYLQSIRHLVEEQPHGGGRGADARRLDVLRLHRPRHVDDEDHGCTVLRNERCSLRPGNADAQGGDGEQKQNGRHVLPPDRSSENAC